LAGGTENHPCESGPAEWLDEDRIVDRLGQSSAVGSAAEELRAHCREHPQRTVLIQRPGQPVEERMLFEFPSSGEQLLGLIDDDQNVQRAVTVLAQLCQIVDRRYQPGGASHQLLHDDIRRTREPMVVECPR
jgi:hypothetical protein